MCRGRMLVCAIFRRCKGKGNVCVGLPIHPSIHLTVGRRIFVVNGRKGLMQSGMVFEDRSEAAENRNLQATPKSENKMQRSTALEVVFGSGLLVGPGKWRG
jgi:hypothetical protein